MTRKLNEADRAAVDLLFDRIRASGAHSGHTGPTGRSGDGDGDGNGGNGGDGVVIMSAAVSDDRLSSVERILHALDHLPAADPPADLVVRTLQRLSRQAGTGMTPLPPSQFIDPSQPIA